MFRIIAFCISLQSTSALICQYGGVYSTSFNQCILPMYSTNYSQAEATCHGLGGSLPCISNENQNIDILKNLQNDCSKNKHEWIGNGEESCKTNYSNLENSAQSNGCISMDTSSGDWELSACAENYPFQCIYPIHNYCDGDWIHYGSSCFNVISIPLSENGSSWYESQQYCMAQYSQLGAYLTSILNAEENNLILTISMVSQPVGSSIWLGLYQIDESNYKWADGSGLIYQNFVNTDPGKLQCGSMTLQDDSLGQWITNNCTDMMRSFVCRYDL